ncbi:MAG: hypothetical protein ACOX16_01975 [Candidatus Izemoplasmatales bacterium]
MGNIFSSLHFVCLWEHTLFQKDYVMRMEDGVLIKIAPRHRLLQGLSSR